MAIPSVCLGGEWFGRVASGANIPPAETMNGYLVVTCEHGGNRIPLPYRQLFQTDRDRELLDSHRGFDAGALILAREMARRLAAPLVVSTVSRLLVDLNRSLGNPRVYSPAVRDANEAVRLKIVEDHYRPYRAKAENLMRAAVDHGRRVIHVSCHSFTPVFDGTVRNADIGLLYDPARSGELDFCKRWQAALKACAPELKVRRNYPYEGKNDGYTTYLRQRFSPGEYIGIELDVNQKHVVNSHRRWAILRATLVESLRVAARPST